MKMKVSEMTGLSLRWAVAVSQGWRRFDPAVDSGDYIVDGLTFVTEGYWSEELGKDVWTTLLVDDRIYQPDIDWSQGGPIIYRQRISLTDPEGDLAYPGTWAAFKRFIGTETRGPTPLVAAMRCFVTSELGDEVDVPEELLP